MPIATDNTTPLKRALADQDRSYAWLGRQVGVGRMTVLRWAEGLHVPSDETKLLVASTLSMDPGALWLDHDDGGADALPEAA